MFSCYNNIIIIIIIIIIIRRNSESSTVKPVYNGPVYIGHPVYYGHLTTSPTFSAALYFLQTWPVYSGHTVDNSHPAISQGWLCTQVWLH